MKDNFSKRKAYQWIDRDVTAVDLCSSDAWGHLCHSTGVNEAVAVVMKYPPDGGEKVDSSLCEEFD